MAIDPKHLPEDPGILQRMVLDLMAQLDREFAERNKIETLLRELLDAKRNRKSEQLSADQLALFAAAWQAREAEASVAPDGSDDDTGGSGAGEPPAPKKRAGGSLCRGTSSANESCMIWRIRKSTAPPASRISGPSVKSPVSATNTFRRN
ncbi:MAG: hypothetical protein ACR2NN_13735 [Bryobacteraceae bacterium]